MNEEKLQTELEKVKRERDMLQERVARLEPETFSVIPVRWTVDDIAHLFVEGTSETYMEAVLQQLQSRLELTASAAGWETIRTQKFEAEKELSRKGIINQIQ